MIARRAPVAAESAIEAAHLVKEFTIRHAGYVSLKGRLMALADPRRRRQARAAGRGPGVERRRVLDDVSFRIGHGETVGLIGRNGSGKSTLLSLMARIYRPTAGRVTVRGRVAPLLELGAGFHPELTGVENVYFNGAVLGLTQRQVAARFDDIVAFAELERSIDMPVRNYSSGMLLRLGFATAVHTDADVLLVDEGLAVGDEAFQQKCFAKIEEFQRQGKTIVVVTHELDHLERIAGRILWLKDGKIVMDGDVQTVLSAYSRAMS
jgi:ABC-type polysaccharide/polyol phosphate transport system ATPase subunit